MRKAKVHTEESIKRQFCNRSISRRVAKKRLGAIFVGDKADVKINSVVASWTQQRQSAIRAARIKARAEAAA